MLSYAILFFVLALIAGIVGFGGFVTGTLLWVAKLFVVLFVVLFLMSFAFGRSGGPPAPPTPDPWA